MGRHSRGTLKTVQTPLSESWPVDYQAEVGIIICKNCATLLQSDGHGGLWHKRTGKIACEVTEMIGCSVRVRRLVVDDAP